MFYIDADGISARKSLSNFISSKSAVEDAFHSLDPYTQAFQSALSRLLK